MERNTNVDLARITATIFAVVLHVLGQGGILSSARAGGANYWVAWFLEICAYCAVNCFVLISGFLMVNKSIKLKRIIELWIQALFYSLLLSALIFAFVPESRTADNLMVAIMPIVGKQWWYMSSYFALFFFIPFLNKAINNVSRQTHKKLLILILFGICLIDCVVEVDAFSLGNGYSFVWLMIVYLFGAYIRKYDTQKKITAQKSILCFFAMIILTLASKALIKNVLGQPKYENIFISYISITILLSAVFLFLFFLNIKIGSFCTKLIRLLSPATLGVYLIHVHSLVFKYVVRDAFAFLASKTLLIMLLGIFAATMAIYLLCTFIDRIRILLFKMLRIGKFCDFIAVKIEGLYSKVFEK